MARIWLQITSLYDVTDVKTNIEENLPNRDNFEDLAEYVLKDSIGKIED